MNKPIDIELSHGTKLIAHRGLSGLAPENTVEAFKLAGEYSYYGIECDIHVTKDQEFVVFHDFSLERMTNSKGLIKNLTLEEIKKLRITAGNGINQFEEVKIPLLKEYLDICFTYQVIPIIEIKDITDFNDLDRLILILKEANLFAVVNFISFHLDYLIYLREKEPTVSIQYLVEEINLDVIAICRKYHMNIDSNAQFITSDLIKTCHENKILVNVYTVDNPLTALDLNKHQIDFITTNILHQN